DFDAGCPRTPTLPCTRLRCKQKAWEASHPLLGARRFHRSLTQKRAFPNNSKRKSWGGPDPERRGPRDDQIQRGQSADVRGHCLRPASFFSSTNPSLKECRAE